LKAFEEEFRWIEGEKMKIKSLRFTQIGGWFYLKIVNLYFFLEEEMKAKMPKLLKMSLGSTNFCEWED